MERSHLRSTLTRMAVVALVAAGTVAGSASPSQGFHLSSITASLNTLAGICPPAVQNSSQSPSGARSFNDSIESNSGAMHAEATQVTTMTGTTFLTVHSRGESKVTGSSSGSACTPGSRSDNEVSVSVVGDESGPYHYRLAGSISTTGSGFRSSSSGAGCTSISFADFDDSACSPPDNSDPARISFSRSGTSDNPSLSIRSGMNVGINPEGGSGRSSMTWDFTLTITSGPQQVDCGEPITKNVVLSEDLTCTGHGLIVAFPNIAIDLNGHTIAGDGTAGDLGIDNTAGHNDVRVRSGTIRGFGTGLFFASADGAKLTGLLVENNSSDGVALDNSVTSTIRNVTARGNADGFDLDNCGGCLLENNLAEDNTADGIELAGGDALQGTNTLAGNRSQLNDGDGITIGGASAFNVLRQNKVESNQGSGIVVATGDNILKENQVKLNVLDGIRLAGGTKNRLKDNIASGNQRHGFAIVGGSNPFPNNVLEGNRSIENHQSGFDIGLSTNNHLLSNIAKLNRIVGINLLGASGNKLEGNTSKLNAAVSGPFAGDGIKLFESFANTLTGNLVASNQGDGLLLEDSDNNTVKGNTSKLNRLDGIEIDAQSSVNDVSNNVANDNQGFGLIVFNDTTLGTSNQANGNGLSDCSTPPGSTVQCS